MHRDIADIRSRRPFYTSVSNSLLSRLAALDNPPLGWLTIVFLWVVLILPSGLLNRLFPLDQGGVFDRGAGFPGDLHWMLSPYMGAGRYFPVYWLYNALLFRLSATNTSVQYLVQSFLFLASALIAGRIFASVTARGLIAACFGIAIFASSPNVEALYTLFKAEPLVLFFTTSILLLFYFEENHTSSPSLSKCLSIAVLFALSIWSKETSLALLIFPLAGITAAAIFRRFRALSPGAGDLGRYVRLLLALSVGFALTRLPYLLFKSDAGTTKATYTTFSITPKLILENIAFYATQQPDVIAFGIGASVFLVIVLKGALRGSLEMDRKAASDLIFVISLLTMAWSYFAIFLIWRWAMAYYLFIPAIFFRFAAGYGFYTIIRWRLFGIRARTIWSVAAAGALAYAATYMWYTGAAQVLYSRMYTEALTSYVSLSHEDDSLIIESYPFYAEQVTGSAQVLQTAFHASRRVSGIADLVNPAVITRAMRELLSVSDADLQANETNWPKRDDYVIAFTGSELGSWQVRGVSPFYSDGSDLQRDGGYDMQLLSQDNTYYPAPFMNVWTHRPDLRRVNVGYEIYKVLDGPRFTWLGKYPDGWMGKRARVTLYPAYVSKAYLHISTSKYNPDNSVTVSEDGVVVDTEPLREGSERTIELRAAASGKPTVFEFSVARTFFPKALRLNDDTRELGALVRLEPFAPEPKVGPDADPRAAPPR